LSPKLISAQRSLHIAEKRYACTHMLRSACAHLPSSPYALTCPHAPATASVVLFANNRNQWWACASIYVLILCSTGALCTLYAQSKACVGRMYVNHPGYCSVTQVGSRCA